MCLNACVSFESRIGKNLTLSFYIYFKQRLSDVNCKLIYAFFFELSQSSTTVSTAFFNRSVNIECDLVFIDKILKA